MEANVGLALLERSMFLCVGVKPANAIKGWRVVEVDTCFNNRKHTVVLAYKC